MENKRTNIMVQAMFTFVCQQITVILIMIEIIAKNKDKFFIFVSDVFLQFVKFICTTILHLYLMGELTAALERMKFVLNHGYKFASPNFAFANTVAQSTSILIVEMCSLLIILSSEKALATVMNFIALAIIAAFDDYVY
jgi:hypothetical protein